MIDVEKYRKISKTIIDELVILAEGRKDGMVYIGDIEKSLRVHFPGYQDCTDERQHELSQSMMKAMLKAVKQVGS